MATGSHLKAVDATGNAVRVVTNAGVDSGAEQQIVTLGMADGSIPAGSADGLRVTLGQPAATSAAWTSATAVNTAVTASVVGLGAASVAVQITGTVSGGVLTFEASVDGGTTYLPLALSRVDAMVSERTYALAGGSRLWLVSADGFTHLRVRLSTVVAGTGTATVLVAPVAAALEPFVAPNTDTGTQSSVAGTTTANTTILAANPARQGFTIYNDSAATLFLLLGSATESATVFTLKVPPGGYYEGPFRYTGVVKGHWTSATGNARVTEFT